MLKPNHHHFKLLSTLLRNKSNQPWIKHPINNGGKTKITTTLTQHRPHLKVTRVRIT